MIRSLSAFAALALSAASFAQINAAGDIAYVQNGTSYTYDIRLKNTGTTTIGTLWYAWIPGEDYLPIAPNAIASPTGWTFTQTTSTNFGYGLRWVAPAGSLLAPGGTQSGFKFTTTVTPAELAGLTIFGTHPAVGTTFVYEGGPFVGGSKQIVINPVPEPATFAALVAGTLLLRRRRKV